MYFRFLYSCKIIDLKLKKLFSQLLLGEKKLGKYFIQNINLIPVKILCNSTRSINCYGIPKNPRSVLRTQLLCRD